MKKYLLIPMLLTATTMVHAGSTLGANTAGTSSNISSSDCAMVQTAFDLKLSQNVGAAWKCDTTAAAVNSGSTKGKNSFGGSTSGGTVAACAGKAPDSTNGYNLTPAAVTSGCS